MKYEYFKVYKNEELPKDTFKEFFGSYSFLSYSTGIDLPIKYYHQSGSWGCFCPLDEKCAKYIYLAILEPPHAVLKSSFADSVETIKKMKELKDKLNSL